MAWRERVVSKFIREWMPVDGEGAVNSVNRAAGALWRLHADVGGVDAVAVVAHLPEGRREVSSVTTEDDLRVLADEQARECSRACSRPAWAMPGLRARLRDWRIDVPSKEDSGTAGRMCNPRWWRRRLRALQRRCVERAAMALRMLGAGAERYCTRESERLYVDQLERSRAMMAATKIQNEAGQVTTLLAAHDASVSNPALRMAEMVTRVKGHEAVAVERGDVCLFITVTCPSKFHAIKIDGQRNDKWKGATPRDAQSHLCRWWGSVRRRLGEVGIFMHGVRVVEPHHDGCPHWHMLVWLDSGYQSVARQMMTREALRVDGQEPGAASSRIRFEKVMSGEGKSAVGYIMKYIVKNIPSGIDAQASCLTNIAENESKHGLKTVRHDGPELRKANLRPMVWARVWGVRQFQFFGSAPVTLWRALRKMPLSAFDGPVRAVVESCHRVGDRMADYAVFLREACKGVFGVPLVGFAALKGWSDRANQYGEPQGEVAIGLTTAIGFNYHDFRARWRVVGAARTRCNNYPGSGTSEGACPWRNSKLTI